MKEGDSMSFLSSTAFGLEYILAAHNVQVSSSWLTANAHRCPLLPLPSPPPQSTQHEFPPNLQANIPSPTADYHNYDEADEETQKHLQKEYAEAEKHGWTEGKPGSFLNRLISHGNKKTEEELKGSSSSGGSEASGTSS